MQEHSTGGSTMHVSINKHDEFIELLDRKLDKQDFTD